MITLKEMGTKSYFEYGSVKLTREQFYDVMNVRDAMIREWDTGTYTFQDEKKFKMQLSNILSCKITDDRVNSIYTKLYNEIDTIPDDLI